MKREVRKISIIAGTTYYITIPKWMVVQLKWRKGLRVEIRLNEDKIELLDWKKTNLSAH
jgi:hypothetical protein